jgi:type IV secretion system protein VirD4
VALIFQAPSQLREVYGPENAKTMMKSLGARIVFAPRDFDDSKEISDDLGNTTVRARSKSRPLSLGFSSQRSRQASVTISEQRRPLLLPQEVRELGPSKAIIFVEGLRPILARKVVYYRDRRFRSRLRPAPVQQIAAEAVFRQAPDPHSEATVDAAAATSLIPEKSVTDHPSQVAALREPTVADLPTLDSLTLEDFVGKYDQVEVRQDRPATPEELQRAVDQFLAGLTA